MPETVYLLLGSNMGDRDKNLTSALGQLAALEGLECTAVSAVYITEAREMVGENPSFLNQVVKADYAFSANELLHALEKIETNLGRTDKGAKKPRTIDCDILLFGDKVIDTPTLKVPHPRLTQRPFALVPLVEIDPQLIHPVTRRPLTEYLSAKDRAEVILYKDHVARNI
jgi:2-amino-4-hydroxy-6-hydroxymethyldihydropteridine diphosphokinase